MLPRFEGIDVEVYGVSPDSCKKHVKFKEKHGFTYPLISDADHAIAEAFGVWGEKTFMGRRFMGIQRTTFVIDADGRIAHVFENVKPVGHANDVADVVAKLP